MEKSKTPTKINAPFKISGKVIQGKLEGRKLGFPTANIYLEKEIPSGIYAGLAILNGKIYQTAIYIRRNQKVLESHLLNFSGDIYGQILTVKVEKKIREDKRFNSEKDLLNAIEKDIQALKNFYHKARLG